MSTVEYVRIRCPRCGRLVAEVSRESTLRIKCGRCKALVEWPVPDTIRR